MTIQSTLAQSHSEDYPHIEPLPDPPREPDMVQRKSLSTIDGTLGPYFAAFNDVLLTGEIYVRFDDNDARELAPDFIFARQVSTPERVIRRNRVCDKRGGQATRSGVGGGFAQHGQARLYRKARGLRRSRHPGILALRPVGWRISRQAPCRRHAKRWRVHTHRDCRRVRWEALGIQRDIGAGTLVEEGTLRFRNPENGQFLLTPEELEADRLTRMSEQIQSARHVKPPRLE